MTHRNGPRPPRVLFFDDRYYAAQGAQKLLVQLAGFAQEAGVDVTVGAPRTGPFLDLARSKGLATVEFGLPEALDRWGGSLLSRSPREITSTVRALSRQNVALARSIRAREYDLVWSAAMRATLSLVGTAVGGRARTPVVWQIMGSGYFTGFSEVASLVATRIVVIAHGLVPTVGKLRDLPWIRRKVRVVQTGLAAPAEIDDPRARLCSELNLPPGSAEKVWIVSLGAHIEEKGLLDVLRAVESLPPPQRDNVILLLGGPPHDAEYARDLQHAVADSPATVELRGWVADTGAWLWAADIFVLASRREGMPLTLVEAMQRQAVPVAYPVGGVPELVIPGETGLLVDVGSIGGLSGALARLVEDAATRQRMGLRARALVMRHNTLDGMRQKFLDVLWECLGTKSRSRRAA